MQWRGGVSFLREGALEGVAGIHNPSGEIVQFSSCLIQGLLIAENAG